MPDGSRRVLCPQEYPALSLSPYYERQNTVQTFQEGRPAKTPEEEGEHGTRGRVSRLYER
jgi:hypothetical protein